MTTTILLTEYIYQPTQSQVKFLLFVLWHVRTYTINKLTLSTNSLFDINLVKRLI